MGLAEMTAGGQRAKVPMSHVKCIEFWGADVAYCRESPN
jgi:hypothetical protein